MDANPVRVVYIAGCGRSGSTLLDNILGQLEGCFSCGELWHVWRRGWIENRLCSDGLAFREHPFWREVFARAFGGMDALPRDSLLAQEARALDVRTRYPALACGRAPRGVDPDRAYPRALAALYRAIRDVSGARVLVDSSKYPVYGALLGGLPGVSLRVLHLVRDPRAVAHSWQRRRHQPDKGAPMDRHGLPWSALQWGLANAAAETLRGAHPYQLLRYEDLVATPRARLQPVVDWLELGPVTLPLHDEHAVRLRPNHAFSGNPGRFTDGVVALVADEEWRDRLAAWRRLALETLLHRSMVRYGYLGRAHAHDVA